MAPSGIRILPVEVMEGQRFTFSKLRPFRASSTMFDCAASSVSMFPAAHQRRVNQDVSEIPAIDCVQPLVLQTAFQRR